MRFNTNLWTSLEFPICSAFTASEYNKNGDCPADGRYTFSSTFSFPSPKSRLTEWAASGYEGEVDVAIYYDSILVGRCAVEASTKSTESGNMPSGKIGALVVGTLVGLCAFYFMFRCLRGCCTRKGGSIDAKNVDAENPEHFSEPTTRYGRFEAGGAVYEASYGDDCSAKMATRSFSSGPVI